MTTPAGETATVEEITQQLIDFIQTELKVDDVTADSPLRVPGLDSLKLMQMVVKIEARYDIELDSDDEDEDDPETIGELAELVVRRIQESQEG